MYLAAIINIVSLYGMVSELGAVCVMETHFFAPTLLPLSCKIKLFENPPPPRCMRFVWTAL